METLRQILIAMRPRQWTKNLLVFAGLIFAQRATDWRAVAEALEAFELLARLEGILPALESAHAIAHAAKIAPTMRKDQVIIINLSGRGDKDCQEVARLIGR